ncbi:C-type mannose receptor 2-like [Uloborus diversus]|uniref:C-type mannose receptor 2-like n=1 Tax=Uloborus diversus TaxID=327109 RepID=UPI00240A7647|nr:C-type mannose receptor 2-like [Uloborus diversus]
MELIIWCFIFTTLKGFALSVGAPPATLLTRTVLACEEGWYAFEQNCYKIGGSKKIMKVTWWKALEYCTDVGGKLATISSEEEFDFLKTFINLEIRENIWIGLSDSRPGGFSWADGTAANFTNWAYGEPSDTVVGQSNEDCVEQRFCVAHGMRHCSAKGNGEWNDRSCFHELPFVCQKGVTKMSAIEAPLDAKLCSENNNSGWKYRTSCFNFVKERKTWTDAEEYCKTEYTGHLITLRDKTYDMFIDYMLKDITDDIWIGIQLKDSNTQRWSSGWLVVYNGWRRSRRKYLEGTCATRNGIGNWTNEPCTRKFPFVCEISSDQPLVLTPVANDTVCPEGEEDLQDLGGNFCYYFYTKTEVTWHEANFMCMQKGSTLASIHSKEEAEMLNHFVLFTREWLHIGLYRDAAEGNNFVWADRSPFDFQYWDANEPNSDLENCGCLSGTTMRFHNILCDRKLHGFICSARKVLPTVKREKIEGTAVEANEEQKKMCEEKYTSCVPTSSFNILVAALVTIICFDILLRILWMYYVKIQRTKNINNRLSLEFHNK